MLDVLTTLINNLPEALGFVASSIGIGTFFSQSIRNKQVVEEVKSLSKNTNSIFHENTELKDDFENLQSSLDQAVPLLKAIAIRSLVQSLLFLSFFLGFVTLWYYLLSEVLHFFINNLTSIVFALFLFIIAMLILLHSFQTLMQMTDEMGDFFSRSTDIFKLEDIKEATSTFFSNYQNITDDRYSKYFVISQFISLLSFQVISPSERDLLLKYAEIAKLMRSLEAHLMILKINKFVDSFEQYSRDIQHAEKGEINKKE